MNGSNFVVKKPRSSFSQQFRRQKSFNMTMHDNNNSYEEIIFNNNDIIYESIKNFKCYLKHNNIDSVLKEIKMNKYSSEENNIKRKSFWISFKFKRIVNKLISQIKKVKEFKKSKIITKDFQRSNKKSHSSIFLKEKLKIRSLKSNKE